MVVMIISGKWVVTKKYLDHCLSDLSWQKTKPVEAFVPGRGSGRHSGPVTVPDVWPATKLFVLDQNVLTHRRNWKRKGQDGACFSNMDAVFLWKNREMNEKFARIVQAGGGVFSKFEHMADQYDNEKVANIKDRAVKK